MFVDFGLANATALCYGLDPETLVFDPKELIEHFIDIVYERKALSMFPYKTKRNKFSIDQYPGLNISLSYFAIKHENLKIRKNRKGTTPLRCF